MKRFLSCFLIAAALAASAASQAAEPAKGQCVNISDALVAKLTGEGAKPGYAGPTAGVAVDPASGDVFLIINDRGLFRSTDGGQSWAKASDLKPSGLAMRKFKTTGYWISDAGLLVSKDAGATWAVQGAPLKMVQGPYFGKDESHIVVLTKEGFQETTDAGRSWKLAAPLPPDYTADRMTTCAWDAKAGVFYISRMTRPALKFER